MPKESSRYAQPRRPSGLTGQVFGHLMAHLNAGMYARAVEALSVEEADRILEVGFGPGRLLEQLVARTHRGYVVGVDHSEVMCAQALARLERRGWKEPRVRIVNASVASLPLEDAAFDKVCAVNTAQFWPDLGRSLAEVRRVTRPAGLVVFVNRANETGTDGAFSSRDRSGGFSKRLAEALAAAAFRAIEVDVRREGACVTARV